MSTLILAVPTLIETGLQACLQRETYFNFSVLSMIENIVGSHLLPRDHCPGLYERGNLSCLRADFTYFEWGTHRFHIAWPHIFFKRRLKYEIHLFSVTAYQNKAECFTEKDVQLPEEESDDDMGYGLFVSE